MDPDLVVPDPEKSLYDGAIEPWSQSTSTYYLQALDGIARHFRESLHTPWQELPEAMRRLILDGSGEEAVELSFDDGLRRYGTNRPFEGVLPNLQRRWRETESAWLKDELGRYLSSAPCEACARPPPQARGARGQGRRPPRRRGHRARDRAGGGLVPGAAGAAHARSRTRSRRASSRRSTSAWASSGTSASAT